MHFSTGQIVCLEDSTYKHKLLFVVEEKNKGQKSYCFARPREPYHRLHVNQSGKVSFDNKQQNHGSLFTIVVSPTDTTFYRIQTIALTTNVYVGVQPDGSLHTQSIVQNDHEMTQQSVLLPLSVDFRVLDSGTPVAGDKNDNTTNPTAALDALLQPWELRRFVSEGFLVVRNGVQPHVLERCTRKLVHALSIPGAMVAGGTQGGDVGKLAGSYSNCPEVRELFLGSSKDKGRTRADKTGGAIDARQPPMTALALAETLMGQGLVDCSGSALSAQIAFRFPEPPPPLATTMLDDEEEEEEEDDSINQTTSKTPPSAAAFGSSSSSSSLGSSWHTDGLRQGRGHPFSLLVGICLSDVTQEFAGNLLVWPGSHKMLHACKAAARAKAAEPSSSSSSLSPASLSEGSLNPSPSPDHGAIDVALLRRMVVADHLAAQGREVTNDSLAHMLGSPEARPGLGPGTVTGDPTSSPSAPSPLPAAATAHHDNAPADLPDLGPPHHVLARAGDVVLVHPDLAHAGGPNRTSGGVRMMVYFRVKAKHLLSSPPLAAPGGASGSPWDAICEAHRADMWVDLPGVQGVLHREGRGGGTSFDR